MQLLFATSKLNIAGHSYEGLPLLVSEGKAVEPAQTFLWVLLTRSGRRSNKATWLKYGQAMYDFLAFCEGSNIKWNEGPRPGLPRAIDRYRDWSNTVVGNSPSTINQRVRIVDKFYKWATGCGFISNQIDSSPYSRSNREPSFLNHASVGVRLQDQSLLNEQRQVIRFATAAEVKELIKSIKNRTHRLMFELMVRTGLRQVECRTFPSHYVFDPERRKGLSKGQMIKIDLNPREMHIKFGKPRTVDLPWSLMEDLWWYLMTIRPARALMSKTHQRELFLTENGLPFKSTSIISCFSEISRRTGIHIRPHMLRHTYATYTLWSLNKSNFSGEALLYLRDRLGHSSVTTTSKYLHLVNQLEAQLILQHENEIDQLFEMDK